MSLPRNMTDLMIKEGVIAFIGPDESCLYEALVASAWNLPMISYVSRRQMEQLIDDGSKFCNKWKIRKCKICCSLSISFYKKRS